MTDLDMRAVDDAYQRASETLAAGENTHSAIAEAVGRLEDHVAHLIRKNNEEAAKLQEKRDELRQARIREHEALSRSEAAEVQLDEWEQKRADELAALEEERLAKINELRIEHDTELLEAREETEAVADRLGLVEEREDNLSIDMSRLVDEMSITLRQHRRLQARDGEETDIPRQKPPRPKSNGVLVVDGDSVAAAGWPTHDLVSARFELMAALRKFAPQSPHCIEVVFGGDSGIQLGVGADPYLRIRIVQQSVFLATALAALVSAHAQRSPLIVVSDQIVATKQLPPDGFSAALKSFAKSLESGQRSVQ